MTNRDNFPVSYLSYYYSSCAGFDIDQDFDSDYDYADYEDENDIFGIAKSFNDPKVRYIKFLALQVCICHFRFQMLFAQLIQKTQVSLKWSVWL